MANRKTARARSQPAQPAATRSKLVALEAHARTNHQVSVDRLLTMVEREVENRRTTDTPVTGALVILFHDGPSGYSVDYFRSKLTSERELYILEQAKLKTLVDVREAGE